METASAPDAIAAVSVGVHGPLALVENEPPAELDAKVTETGNPAGYPSPVFVRCSTVSGLDAPPTTIVCGAVVNASLDGFQVANVCQPLLNAAPGRSPPHQDGAQASAPAIAAASRSRIAPVCALKSAGASACRFLGAQAKPKRDPL